MALVPGLRFQILLVVIGLAALSTFLTAMVTLAAVDRLAAESRGQVEAVAAEAVGAAARDRCPEGERACVEGLVAELLDGRARLSDAPAATRIPGTPFGIAIANASGGRPSEVRRLLLGFLGLNALVLVFLGGFVLVRAVVRPVEALTRQVDRVGRLEFGESGEGHQLGRLGTSFRRMVGALAEERERVQRQIGELETANRSLREAQESLVRSEKLATVGRLSAGLAHEVGNPLASLVGYLELLKSRTRDDPGKTELVQGAADAAERIDRTIRDLLDFSRSDTTPPAPFEIGAAVDDALGLMAPRQRFAEIDVAVVLPEDLPKVLGDRRRISQVLVNLLLNAADAMEGCGRIRIEGIHDAEAAEVRVVVADDGPGLPEGAGDEVFEPFFTTKAPGEGTGLGLAISRRIAESAGGRLATAPSALGGAAFVLGLRAAAPLNR
jgi:two-component system, NtrC family, sensor kinase